MKQFLPSNRIFKFAKNRSRFPSNPTNGIKKTSESEGSSSLSLGAIQRRGIASSLNTPLATEKDVSHFMQLNKEGKIDKRRRKSFLCYQSSENFNKTDDLTSSRSSSIDILTLENQTQEQERNSNYDTSACSSVFAEECNHGVGSIDDFVLPISSMEKRQPYHSTSRKKKKRTLNTFRIYLRKALKLPLDKSHQRWSRFSFDSRMSSELRL